MIDWEDLKKLMQAINKAYEEAELDSISTDIRADLLMLVMQQEDRPRGMRSEIIVFDDYRELTKEDEELLKNLLKNNGVKSWYGLSDEEKKEWLGD